MGQAAGIAPDLRHRVTAMATGRLDTLPHNGADITLLTMVIPTIGLAVLNALGKLFGGIGTRRARHLAPNTLDEGPSPRRPGMGKGAKPPDPRPLNLRRHMSRNTVSSAPSPCRRMSNR